MVNRQPEKSAAELEAEADTVDLTVSELQSVSGGHGVFLNLEVEKRPKTNDHQHPHHGKR